MAKKIPPGRRRARHNRLASGEPAGYASGMRLLFFCAAVFACCALSAREVYVSSSEGLDTNDGSRRAPLKTLAAAPKENAKIFLKRGDTFYEELKNFKNCEFAPYGNGPKPLICGLMMLKNTKAWIRLPNHIWKLDLSKAENFDGFVPHASPELLNLGAVYDISSDKIYGRLQTRLSALNAHGDFFVAAGEWAKAGDVLKPKHPFKYLYFRLPKNPSENGAKISFLVGTHGVSNLQSCKLKDLAIKGFGKHGICKSSDCVFDGIDLDLIGGCILPNYSGGWVRFGNGVEFWITSKKSFNNNLVQNCRISRTYDCGSTIQGISNGNLTAKNIIFKNNVFYRCRQAFEHFLRSKDGGATSYENCAFENNIAYECGDNGFSTPETRDAALLAAEGNNTADGLVVKNNIFWNSNCYFIRTFPANLKSNKFFVGAGNYLQASSSVSMPTLWADSPDDIKKFESKFPSNSVFLISPETAEIESALREKVFGKKPRQF